MAVRLEDIGKLCTSEANAPGLITQMMILPECAVDALPAVDAYDPDDVTPDAELAHTISTDITVKTGYYWTLWTLRKLGATHKQEITGEEDAEQVQVTMAGFIPKQSNLKTWYMNQGINGRFLVLFKFRNDPDWYLIGESDNGAKVKVTADSNPKNGYTLEITCLQDNFCYRYTGAVTPLNP